MHGVRKLLLALVLLALSAVATASAASRHKTVFQSRHLWATVDVCDTAAHPRTVGVRGSMPGSGIKREEMFMRFEVQYRSGAAWIPIGAKADSGFLDVGPATLKARQAGRSFEIAPTPGARYVLRGVVTFQWRRGALVVRHARKATSAGHHVSAGSDPRGYSAAACALG